MSFKSKPLLGKAQLGSIPRARWSPSRPGSLWSSCHGPTFGVITSISSPRPMGTEPDRARAGLQMTQWMHTAGHLLDLGIVLRGGVTSGLHLAKKKCAWNSGGRWRERETNNLVPEGQVLGISKGWTTAGENTKKNPYHCNFCLSLSGTTEKLWEGIRWHFSRQITCLKQYVSTGTT